MKKKRLVFSLFLLLFMVPVYAGVVDLNAPVTLDIKGMDILDVLKIISLRSGLSIAASPLVRGKVTFFLKDVSAWDAFEILVAANNLAYEKRGSIINVMTNREYEDKYGKPFYDLRVFKKYSLKNAKAEMLGKTIRELKSKIGKVIVDDYSNSIIVLDTPDVIYEIDKAIKGMDKSLETKVVHLNYVQVKDVKDSVSDLVSKNVGSIKFDEVSNRVVITDIPSNVEHIVKVLKAFDKRPRAVQIEAKIIQITLNDEYRYGIDWGVVFGKEAGIFYQGTLPTTEGGLGKIAVGKVVFNESQALTTKHQYRGLFKLFSTFGKTDVLSSPRITVLDNKESYVLVGTKEPVISVTQTYPQSGESVYSESVQYIDTGIRLSVTPHISDEGFIRMKIKPEVSSAEYVTTERGSKYPKKSTSETETTVIVKDGNTIVLAGLMKNTKTKNREKVPGLGDIPVLGKLFSGKYEKNEKTELVILLTPHIITGEKTTPQKEQVAGTKKEQVGISGIGEQKPIQLRPKKVKKSLVQEEERKAYSEYYLTVANKIYNYLNKNYLGLGLKEEVNIVFLLNKDGSLVGEPAVIGDVEPTVRDLAIEVVKKSAPFPSFPEALNKKKEAFNILLSFSSAKASRF